MSTRSLIRLIAVLAPAAVSLAACGDVSGGNLNIDGGNWPWPWPQDAEVFVDDTFAEEVPVEGQLRIVLDAVNGRVSLLGRPGADSVGVVAELRVGSHSLTDARQGLDRLEVRVTNRPDEILVRTVQPADAQGRQYLVNYAITVPSDLAVEVTQVNGHVTLRDTESSAFVGLVNGSIDATAELVADAEIQLSTVNGDIGLRIPTSTSAAFSARVANGTIATDNLELRDPVPARRSLTGTLGDGAGSIDLETGNGRIEVTGFEG